jgi:transketolase
MAGIAAGLALSGKVPFITSYAVFSPGRNWDQLRVSVCYSGANVKIMGAHAGISVGPDGATHQALEDITITRVLPGMTVLVPCDVEETRKAVLAAAEFSGPVYIRFGREKVPVVTVPETPFAIGKAQMFRDGTDVVIIACGSMVYHGLMAAEQLKAKGISVAVVNATSVKPLDEETITSIAKQCGAVVTAEEHQITGGLGGTVAECLGQKCPVPIEFVGMPNSFGESGKPSELIAKYGMDTKAVVEAVERVVGRK